MAGRRESDANHKNVKYHPTGVWIFTPTLALGDTCRDEYPAIGECDRMTVQSVKKLLRPHNDSCAFLFMGPTPSYGDG